VLVLWTRTDELSDQLPYRANNSELQLDRLRDLFVPLRRKGKGATNTVAPATVLARTLATAIANGTANEVAVPGNGDVHGGIENETGRDLAVRDWVVGVCGFGLPSMIKNLVL
jgi:hypothetical protein